MAKKILIAMPLEQKHRDYFERLAAGHKIKFTTVQDMTADDVKDVTCIIGSIKRKWIKAADKLEWLQIIYAGADLYVVPNLLNPETILTNAAGAYDTAVSEHMLAMTFALIRRFGQYLRNQVNHQWQQMGNIISVKNSKILILGNGRIGNDYARQVKSLGAYTIGINRTGKCNSKYIDEQFSIDKLDEVIGRADIIAMVLPSGEATKHIINADRFSKMKRGAYIINVGRGNAIDFDALKSALKVGSLGGAALDVTEPEPLPADDELWDFDNVIITPHAAGQLFLPETLDNIVEIAGKNLSKYLNDEPLTNVVNKELGY